VGGKLIRQSGRAIFEEHPESKSGGAVLEIGTGRGKGWAGFKCDTTRHCRGARSPGWQRAWLSNSKPHGTPVNANWGFLNAAAFIWFYWLCN
jgi:hypothetical protein